MNASGISKSGKNVFLLKGTLNETPLTEIIIHFTKCTPLTQKMHKIV